MAKVLPIGTYVKDKEIAAYRRHREPTRCDTTMRIIEHLGGDEYLCMPMPTRHMTYPILPHRRKRTEFTALYAPKIPVGTLAMVSVHMPQGAKTVLTMVREEDPYVGPEGRVSYLCKRVDREITALIDYEDMKIKKK